MSGTNSVPLGVRRRWDSQMHADGVATGPLRPSPSPPAPAKSEPAAQTPVKTERQNSPSRPPPEDERQSRPLKRRTRWADESSKAAAAAIPTALPTNLTPNQLEGYIIQLRLEEIGRKLRSGDYVPEEKRSVSPPPEYGIDGRRLNTREQRYRKRLEDERHRLVDKGQRIIPGFRPPADYRKPSRLMEKLYIPVRDFPELNFIGLIIGPRGNTLKKVEVESGTKISIRGKGSVKEGKARSDGGPNPGDEEDLHCIITADSEEKIRRGMEMINKIIETATSIPESQNELKRNQLRELAALNGTLRDDENQICNNCGGIGHRKYECPERRNVTNNLICRLCGGGGHIARDCMQRGNARGAQEGGVRNQRMDNEYANMMAEIGTNPSAGDSAAPPWARANASANDAAAPPWARAASISIDESAPPPWVRPAADGIPPPPPPEDGSVPPWAHAHGAADAMPPWQQAAADGAAPPWMQHPSATAGAAMPWQPPYGHDAGAAPPWQAPPPSGESAAPPWQQPQGGYAHWEAYPHMPVGAAYGYPSMAMPPDPNMADPSAAHMPPPPPPPEESN